MKSRKTTLATLPTLAEADDQRARKLRNKVDDFHDLVTSFCDIVREDQYSLAYVLASDFTRRGSTIFLHIPPVFPP